MMSWYTLFFNSPYALSRFEIEYSEESSGGLLFNIGLCWVQDERPLRFGQAKPVSVFQSITGELILMVFWQVTIHWFIEVLA